MSWKRVKCPACCAAAALPLLLLLGNSGAAFAQSLDAQARTTTAGAFYFVEGISSDTAFDGKVAPGFGLFNEATAVTTGVAGVSVGVGESVQTTDIQLSDGVLTTSGSGSAGAAFDVNGPGFSSSASGSGQTTFDLLFTIDEPTHYGIGVALQAELIELSRLVGGVSATGSASASFELRGENLGTIFALAILDDDADGLLLTDSLTTSGVLGPDTYQISLSASTQLDGVANALGEAVAGFGFDLTIAPEPLAPALAASALAVLALLARARRSSRRLESRREIRIAAIDD
jgi:hypothetical protein